MKKLIFTVLFCQISLGFGGRSAVQNCPSTERELTPGSDFNYLVMPIETPCKYGSGDYIRKLSSFGGRFRFYQIHVPKGYSFRRSSSVVFVLHGGGGNPNGIRYNAQMESISEEEGFIIVYPAATSPYLNRTLTDRLLFWNQGIPFKDPIQSEVDDVGFISLIISDLRNYFNLDLNRIHIAGLSNGGMMAYTLASRLYDQIASIAVVGAQRTPNSDGMVPPPGPVSIISFNGVEDTYQPYWGGVYSETGSSAFKSYQIPSVPETVLAWKNHNECKERVRGQRIGNASSTVYTHCRSGKELISWTLFDGGHTWPGGEASPYERSGGPTGHSVGNINRDISASKLMWEFFKRHPRSY